MSLGSESYLEQSESRQNQIVLELLLDNARDMDHKIKNIGLPMEIIKEELYGINKTSKPKSVKKKALNQSPFGGNHYASFEPGETSP